MSVRQCLYQYIESHLLTDMKANKNVLLRGLKTHQWWAQAFCTKEKLASRCGEPFYLYFWPDWTHSVGGCNLRYRIRGIVATWKLQLDKRFDQAFNLAFIWRQFIEGSATSYLIFQGLSGIWKNLFRSLWNEKKANGQIHVLSEDKRKILCKLSLMFCYEIYFIIAIL